MFCFSVGRVSLFNISCLGSSGDVSNRKNNKPNKKDRKELTAGGIILTGVSMIDLKSLHTQLTCLLCLDEKAFIAFQSCLNLVTFLRSEETI